MNSVLEENINKINALVNKIAKDKIFYPSIRYKTDQIKLFNDCFSRLLNTFSSKNVCAVALDRSKNVVFSFNNKLNDGEYRKLDDFIDCLNEKQSDLKINLYSKFRSFFDKNNFYDYFKRDNKQKNEQLLLEFQEILSNLENGYSLQELQKFYNFIKNEKMFSEERKRHYYKAIYKFLLIYLDIELIAFSIGYFTINSLNLIDFYLESKTNVYHCETKLAIDFILRNQINENDAYIGVSKLCCPCCEKFLNFLNFEYRGNHSSLAKNWTLDYEHVKSANEEQSRSLIYAFESFLKWTQNLNCTEQIHSTRDVDNTENLGLDYPINLNSSDDYEMISNNINDENENENNFNRIFKELYSFYKEFILEFKNNKSQVDKITKKIALLS